MSFREGIESCDRVSQSIPRTSVAHKLKRIADEKGPSTLFVDEDFDDFSIIPQQEILIKAGFSSDLSASHVSKRKKIVMFEKNSPEVKDDDNYIRDQLSEEYQYLFQKQLMHQQIEDHFILSMVNKEK